MGTRTAVTQSNNLQSFSLQKGPKPERQSRVSFPLAHVIKPTLYRNQCDQMVRSFIRYLAFCNK